MKRNGCGFIFMLAIFLLFPVLAQGQNWFLTNVSSNIGKGAFISGFDVTTKFKNSSVGEELEITGNHQRCYFVLGKKLPLCINASISGGFYQNMPWIGPKIDFSPFKFITFQHWSGVSAGEPNNPAWKSNEYIVINSVFLKTERFCFSYVAEEYLESWVTLPGVKLIIPINPEYTMTLGAEYKKTRYVKDEEPLFNLGVSYSPQKR